MSAAARKKPGGNRASTSAYLDAHRQLYGKPPAGYLPDNWRSRLPDPAAYYPRQVHKLGKPNANGWAACRCPFHNDKNASASANLRTGGFRCHACGERGDLIAVHQRLTGLPFKGAVRDLLGLSA